MPAPNRQIGWTLLILGFATAIWLDPWSLSERDPSVLAGSTRMAVRHAQAVLLGMGLLQLAVSQVLAVSLLSPRAGLAAARLTAVGAVLYVLGYGLQIWWPALAWLVPVGAVLNFAGLAVLSWASWRSRRGRVLWIILPVIAFGMLLDVGMGLLALGPEWAAAVSLGHEDGLRLRMLRLARAAAIALPVLALLYHELAERTSTSPRVVGWGRIALLAGAAGMPVLLTAAALISPRLKYLLPVPADAVFVGALVGAWLARHRAPPLELWGWLLIVGSMAAGLWMGGYAFNGPLSPPSGMTAYNDFLRRLIRLAHADAVVLGLTCIFVARERGKGRPFGVPLLIAGSTVTLTAMLLVAAGALSPPSLGLGPALVTGALVLCVGSRWRGPQDK
jgi:hypothetical protein